MTTPLYAVGDRLEICQPGRYWYGRVGVVQQVRQRLIDRGDGAREPAGWEYLATWHVPGRYDGWPRWQGERTLRSAAAQQEITL